MKFKHVIPNAVTLANIALGFLGMVAAARGQFERSVVLLFAAALCDLADGKLARALNATSKFGMELDSLSDMVSFGIAPAVLVYLAVLHKLGTVGLAIAIVYPLCGAIRLARYNSDVSGIGKVTFLGCPIPIAASYLWSMVLVRDGLPVWAIAAGTLTMARRDGLDAQGAEVPQAARACRRGRCSSGLAAFVAFLVRPMALTWHIWNGWNVLLIVANYVQLARRGHLQAARKERHLKAAA